MSAFLTPIVDHQIGPKLWQLDVDFKYKSDVLLPVIVVPSGFQTDYESCPGWLPLINAIFGDVADEPAIVHDWLYYSAITTRLISDQILKEAMDLIPGLATWRKNGIYEGVRLGGWYAWWQHRRAGHSAATFRPPPLAPDGKNLFVPPLDT